MSHNDSEEITYEELENTDVITVELVPERKGLILKHCEYYVSSRRHGTTVSRRYNDFVQLNDVLLAKYPYRAIAHLPPKRVVVGGGSADFLQQRRAALQDWLTLVARHPVLAHDADVRAFLCEVTIKIERPRHDEFMMAGSQEHLNEISIDTLQERFSADHEQLKLARMALEKLHNVFEKVESRSKSESEDIRELSAALTALASAAAAAGRAALTSAANVAAKSPSPPPAPPSPLSLPLLALSAFRALRTRLTRGLHAERAVVNQQRHKYSLYAARQEANVTRAYLSSVMFALPEQFSRHAASRAALAALWRALAAGQHT